MNVPYAFDPTINLLPCCFRPSSAWCSATSPHAVQRAWTLSRHCGTS